MKAIVGIYETHEKALDAIKKLRNEGYPVHQISMLGKGEIIEGEARVKLTSSIAVKEISISAVIGSLLGVLTGVGVFAIPGLGFIYGAGAFFGGFAGFEAGILSGGIAAVLTSIGIDLKRALGYEQHLDAGKFLVIVQGSAEQIEFARKILETHGQHFELNDHE